MPHDEGQSSAVPPPTRVDEDCRVCVLGLWLQIEVSSVGMKVIWTGAPCSHQRTWDEKDGAQPLPMLLPRTKNWCQRGELSGTGAKAFEKIVIGPCTLMRTWGTRRARLENQIGSEAQKSLRD
jgi:hypothetical protein